MGPTKKVLELVASRFFFSREQKSLEYGAILLGQKGNLRIGIQSLSLFLSLFLHSHPSEVGGRVKSRRRREDERRFFFSLSPSFAFFVTL